MILPDLEHLTWKCHICGKERPDEFISVYHRPIYLNGQQVGMQNIRYCNDNPDCFDKAKNFSFLKEN